MGEKAKGFLMRCSNQDWETIKQSEDKQRQFKERVLQRKDFSDVEKATVQFGRIEQLRDYWNQASQAQRDFDDEHVAGCGLCARRYQTSGELVLGFMHDFSPIIDAVKDFAAPFGQLAVGTISLVFVVAQTKDSVEQTLALTISEIRNRLPGVELYRHIYDENHALDHTLQAQIVATYQTFIDFCILATEYYKAGGLQRWLRALYPQQRLAESATRVRDSLTDIKRTSHELLAKNVDHIKKRNQELQDQLTNRDRDEFRRIFKLESFSGDSQLKEFTAYREAMEMDQEINAGHLQQLRGPRLDEFLAHGVYQEWTASKQPRLLILDGRNSGGISTQCWLSWVAISTIERLRNSSDQYAYAYYIVPQQGASLYQVLPTILLQLMTQKKDMLRVGKQRDALRAELYKYQESAMTKSANMMGSDRQTDVLHDIARRVVEFFNESETLYIIIDRVDRCCDYRNFDHRKSLMDGLVRMVNVARCKLKILSVSESSGWSIEHHRDELGILAMDRVVVHTKHQSYAATG
ncbi:hypothetical protein BDV19DRAFT_352147 [Aspergillus venezuelensis]